LWKRPKRISFNIVDPAVDLFRRAKEDLGSLDNDGIVDVHVIQAPHLSSQAFSDSVPHRQCVITMPADHPVNVV
jgi:hypothetical protein